MNCLHFERRFTLITLSTIHEKKLTRFHRNNYIICISNLTNKSSLEGDDLQNEKHFSIETCNSLYPKASMETKAGIFLTSIQRKIQEGEHNFLLVYNDDTKHEAMDILNALVLVLELEPTNEEQKMKYESLRAFANAWTHAILRAEQKYNKIKNALLH